MNETRKEVRKQVADEFKRAGVDASRLSEEEINSIIEDRVKEDIKNGVQTMQYQINTLMTTNGQAPFVSVFMYLNEVDDPQTKADLALVIEEVLKQRTQGIKNEQGAWITPSFPKILYTLEPDNIEEGQPYWYLTKLAAKCTAKRMVPDYISEKIMLENKIDKNGEGHCYPCMGMKTMIAHVKPGERMQKRCA